MRSLLQSLTGRLAVLFALLAMATFAAVGAYLHQSLATQLRHRDDTEVLGKVTQIRHLLREMDSEEAILRDPTRFTDIAAGHEGLILMVRSRQGRELVSVNPTHEVLPPFRVLSAVAEPTEADVQPWLPRSRAPSRGIAVLGVLDGSDQAVEVIVARDSEERAGLLADYRRHIVWATIGGALVSAILGFVLVRQSLASVRKIAARVSAVTVNQLQTRLDPGTAPSELKELVSTLNGMLSRLEDGFHRISQFSADLAHDFRTPISNLIGQTQVTLAQRRSADEYESILESSLEEYERMARMTENMLFLARADNAQVAPKKFTLDAAEELGRVAEYFEAVAADQDLEVRVRGHGRTVADQMLLRRAVNNLVDNALRYAAKNSVVVIEVDEAGGETSVRVINNGVGLPIEEIGKVFDRFYRSDPARSNSASSAGLGLAIVKSIVELHGGSVRASSQAGETCFELLFPSTP